MVNTIHRIYLIHGTNLIRGKYRTFGIYLIQGILPYTWFILYIVVILELLKALLSFYLKELLQAQNH